MRLRKNQNNLCDISHEMTFEINYYWHIRIDFRLLFDYYMNIIFSFDYILENSKIILKKCK